MNCTRYEFIYHNDIPTIPESIEHYIRHIALAKARRTDATIRRAVLNFRSTPTHRIPIIIIEKHPDGSEKVRVE